MSDRPRLSSRLAAAWPWAVLGVILLWGAWWRFSWPLWPVSDADTWGYLNPGLSKLAGGPFEHTLGRNFVYPGFLWLVLRLTGDFRAVTVVQHVLGLASGGLLWLFWRRWSGTFLRPALPRLPAWAVDLAGLALVAFYEGSVSNLAFEHYLRPEAVFPFFAILDLLLLLEFIHAWFRQRRPVRAGLLALAALFTGALLYQLKPSFGLTLGCVALPLAAAWFFPRRPAPPAWRARAGLGLAVATAAALTLGLFLRPEKALARGDRWSTLFLPETLLTIHADLLRDQMAADLRAGPVPYDRDWLAANCSDLDRELRIASTPERLPFRSLGFNPDYLLYSNASFCHRLNAQLAPAQAAAFAFHFYARAWESRPFAMSRKVGRQLRLFYNLHCPAYWPLGSLPMSYYYQKTANSYLYPEYQRRMARYPPAQAYLDAARALAPSPAVLRVSPVMVAANVAASVTYTATLCLFMLGLGWAAVRRRAFLPAAVPVLLAYGFNAGNCLTIAIVHSLYGDRYSYNQLIFTALAQTSALVWLAALAVSRFPPANASRPPDCGGSPLPPRALPPAGPTPPGRSGETLPR